VTKRFGTAVVCGAGLAGLSAARALTDSFDRVIIIERDELDDAPKPRALASRRDARFIPCANCSGTPTDAQRRSPSASAPERGWDR
jgi:glycine/D-amino acid oxidase-like deaminating enzyme